MIGTNYAVDITGRTQHLSFTGKVTGKLPEYIDPVLEERSCFGILLSISGMNIPFHAYGSIKGKIVRSLSVGDNVRVLFQIRHKQPGSGYANIKFKIYSIEIVDRYSIP